MSTLPTFPNFKEIEISDKEKVREFTRSFPPYSDFNFTALWSWSFDENQKMLISQLNENLVVLFNDYVSGQRFLAFIGRNKISETAGQLISYSKVNYNTDFLKLVPEETVKLLDKNKFNIIEDESSYDYVYSIEDLKNMDKWSKGDIGKLIEEFKQKYPNYEIKLSSLAEVDKKNCLDVFKKWSESKNIKNHYELNEFKAFQKFLENKDTNIEIISIYVDGNLIGLNTYEILSEEYANSGFSKADVKHHKSIYKILNWEEAKILNSKKIKFYNWEQDLGIPGLQYSKKKYNPAFFLKKYIITRK